MTAGYSGTPLVKKLGYKRGYKVALIHAPANYQELLGELPPDVSIVAFDALPDSNEDHYLQTGLDLIHFFTTSSTELRTSFPHLKRSIAPNGMVWISWPKTVKSSTLKIHTDLNDSVVRQIGLDAGLVDVKVAAVDAVWSGLKFVYRLVDRSSE